MRAREGRRGREGGGGCDAAAQPLLVLPHQAGRHRLLRRQRQRLRQGQLLLVLLGVHGLGGLVGLQGVGLGQVAGVGVGVLLQGARGRGECVQREGAGGRVVVCRVAHGAWG